MSYRFTWKSAAFSAMVIAGLVVLWPLPAMSQGCALCYTQAAASGNRMIHALRQGIVILVAPPMLLSIGFGLLAYRKRNQFKQEDFEDGARVANSHRRYR